ncbi:MAG: hypothetical protein AABX65_03860 [Nanoarchaeota archaeon]
MRGKKGQFYLLAAAMIIGLLFGLGVVGNKIIVAGEKASVGKLAGEVKLETGGVVANSLYVGANTKSKLDEWTDTYANYSLGVDPETEWAFIYGKDNSFNIAKIEKEDSGCISVPGAGVCNINRKRKDESFSQNGGKLNQEFKGKGYEFPVSIGENFYFILNSKDKSGEYVEKG